MSDEEKNADVLLTVNEVMSKLRICRRTVYRYINSGKLGECPMVALQWRIHSTNLEQFMQTLRRSPSAIPEAKPITQKRIYNRRVVKGKHKRKGKGK